jgi:transcriptional regulator with XRE-family HTH domain
MLLIRITGNQIRAGRALAGLTIEDLAARAQLCRHSVRKWETSSNAAPSAMVDHLSRALDVLEAGGRSSAAMGSTHYAASTITKLSK